METPPEPMSVDSEDHYTPQQHETMDKLVGDDLKRELVIGRFPLSKAELRTLLHTVVKHDPKLDRKFKEAANFPEDLGDMLTEAFRTMSFRDIRILARLQAPVQSRAELPGEAMTLDYKGTSVEAFVQYLEQNNMEFVSHGTYYGKFCSITQSSGAGKTRLLFELGKKNICVLYINIRSKGDKGSPPRDTIPADFLSVFPPKADSYHDRCRAFFATIFKCLAKFLQDESNPFGVLSNVEDKRRAQFFENVRKEFTNVEQEFPSLSVMYRYFEEVLDVLPQQEFDHFPKLVIALDEAHVLHEKSGDEDYLPATVFLQTIKEYSSMRTEEPVWVVFASTTSKIAHYAAPQALFPSERVAIEEQLVFPPFTQLGRDHCAPGLGQVELDKVAWGSHLLGYGRPLWMSLREYRTLGDIIKLAGQKLCAWSIFNSSENLQVFAVLGQRFGLDVAFGHRHAVRYSDAVIASHLRICIKTTDDRTWSYTTYPSEPILSAAAADLLYSANGNLSNAFTRLSFMVNDGLIDIGDSGELASRFLWLLAKDACIQRNLEQRFPAPSVNHGVTGDFELKYCRLVPVVKYLELLFGPDFWQNAPDARSTFQDAYVNFSHWVQMRFDITRGKGGCNDVSIEKWTTSLWARTSAVQCCHNQPVIDKVIPVYFKSWSQGSKMSHILISDKARENPQERILGGIRRGHKNIAPHYQGPPYIAILADLGVQDSGLTVVDRCSEAKDRCLRIHSIGLTEETYPFLKDEGIAKVLSDLYARQSVPPGPEYMVDLEDQVQYGWSREARYMNLKD